MHQGVYTAGLFRRVSGSSPIKIRLDGLHSQNQNQDQNQNQMNDQMRADEFDRHSRAGCSCSAAGLVRSSQSHHFPGQMEADDEIGKYSLPPTRLTEYQL